MCCSQCLISKYYCKHFENNCSIFTQDVALKKAKIQAEKHKLLLNKTLPNKYTFCRLPQSKQSEQTTTSTPNRRSLCQQQCYLAVTMKTDRMF